MKTRYVKYIMIIIFALQMICIPTGCTADSENSEITEPQSNNNDNAELNQNGNNEQIKQTEQTEGDIQMVNSNISWESNQALPAFSAPAEKLYVLHTGSFKPDERVTLSAFQGIINKTKPRVLLIEDGDTPSDTWIKTFHLSTSVYADKYELIARFKSEIKGIVVYDTSKSVHYRNIASTIANINGYIPVTNAIKNTLSRYDVAFDEANIIDITDWTQESPIEIYGKLYDEYWGKCSKRLLISADPAHDLDHTRDIAAAVGAAVIYLDCTKANEKELYEKFMQGMADNREKNNETAIVMGWFTTERSGVIAGSAYGISTVPADFYISGSVYSGVTYNENPEDCTIHIPAVPPKNDLENKIYIAVFFTDGDNIQYMQRFMRKLWDSAEETKNRGKVPVNWTISPSLADIGPGILNYYYSKATDKECFVAGPSGMGYLMPINTNKETGIKLGDFLTNRKYMDDYTKLTEEYMRRTGLRALTIWDDANDDLRDSYEQNCRYLYGATVQNFGAGKVSSSTVNDRLRFIKHETHYEGQYNTVLSDMTRKINAWNGNEPLFLSYQVKVWEFHTPQLVKLYEAMKQKFGNRVEFVRADHFFALYNEANGLPFNLCMNGKTTAASSDTDSKPSDAKDGTPATVWTAKGEGDKWIQFDFNGTYTITRCSIIQPSCNFLLQFSENGSDWVNGIELIYNETEEYELSNIIDIDLKNPIKARYAKIIFEDKNDPNFTVSIADIEIYGHSAK